MILEAGYGGLSLYQRLEISRVQSLEICRFCTLEFLDPVLQKFLGIRDKLNFDLETSSGDLPDFTEILILWVQKLNMDVPS